MFVGFRCYVARLVKGWVGSIVGLPAAHVACCYSVVAAGGQSDYSTEPQAAGACWVGRASLRDGKPIRLPAKFGGRAPWSGRPGTGQRRTDRPQPGAAGSASVTCTGLAKRSRALLRSNLTRDSQAEGASRTCCCPGRCSDRGSPLEQHLRTPEPCLKKPFLKRVERLDEWPPARAAAGAAAASAGRAIHSTRPPPAPHATGECPGGA